MENIHIMTLTERLNNPKMCKAEFGVLEMLKKIVFEQQFNKESIALSFGVGDGIWDYLVFKGNSNISKITAVDIVDNSVTKDNIDLLNKMGRWEFKKVQSDTKLPFSESTFDLVFHSDVIEHTEKPFFMLNEQYRVLKSGGVLIINTPNLFRPMNLFKLLIGRLSFPIKIGSSIELGDYIHQQEFFEGQLFVMLKEVGFKDVACHPIFFGFHPLNFTISLYPKTNFQRTMAHNLVFVAKK